MKKLLITSLLSLFPALYAQSAYVTFEVYDLFGSQSVGSDDEFFDLQPTTFEVTFEFSANNPTYNSEGGILFGSSDDVIGESLNYTTNFTSQQDIQTTPFDTLYDDFSATYSRADSFEKHRVTDLVDIEYLYREYEIYPEFNDDPMSDYWSGLRVSGILFDAGTRNLDWTFDNNQYVGQWHSTSLGIQGFLDNDVYDQLPASGSFGDASDLAAFLQFNLDNNLPFHFSKQTNIHDFVTVDNRIDYDDYIERRNFYIGGQARLIDFDLTDTATVSQIPEPPVYLLMMSASFLLFRLKKSRNR